MEEDRGREQRWRKTGEGSRDGRGQGKGRDMEREKKSRRRAQMEEYNWETERDMEEGPREEMECSLYNPIVALTMILHYY